MLFPINEINVFGLVNVESCYLDRKVNNFLGVYNKSFFQRL